MKYKEKSPVEQTLVGIFSMDKVFYKNKQNVQIPPNKQTWMISSTSAIEKELTENSSCTFKGDPSDLL